MTASDAEIYLRRARQALDELSRWYSPLRRRWRTTGWWNAAAILTTHIRFARLTGDETCGGLPERIHAGRWRRGRRDFTNRYYDDEGWWAAAWIEACELTGDGRYLDTAIRLFDDMRGGWSETCGGGIYWRKGGVYKAAIANSLYIQIAADLYLQTGVPEYLGEARRCRIWFDAAGLAGEDDLVRDGVGGDCTVAGDIWTYNQGAAIGARVLLARASARDGGGAGDHIAAAKRTAHALIDGLASSRGVLREEGEPGLNRDRVQFKGLTMRFLTDFWRETRDRRVASFIIANADSLWARARKDGTNRVGASWEGPFDRADAGRQGSACDALVAAAEVALGGAHGERSRHR